MEKIVVIVGPTASGKSALALEIAKKYNGEIICADSRTVYKGLDIGSDKPTKSDQRKVKHHLLDMASLDQDFSVYDFQLVAKKSLKSILSRGKLAIIVGGSGLYIDAIIFDYQFRNPRFYPDEDIDGKSLKELVDIAKNKYPSYISKIDIKNRRRVEQLIIKGPSKDTDRSSLKKNALIICLNPEMALIRQKVSLRLDAMLSKGFIQEVESLRKKYGLKNKLLQTTGYKRVGEYLDKKINLGQMKELIIKDTTTLARKQITWFRRNQYVKWVSDKNQANKIIKKFLLN